MDAVTLRARGVGRFFMAAFLGVWLAMWVVGEAVGIGLLATVLLGGLAHKSVRQWPGDVPPEAFGVVLVFLLLWVTFWTFGGLTAIVHFLRSLAGADHVRMLADGFELTQRAGPFRRVRTLQRAELRRIRVRGHDKALVADTVAATRLISDLGTVAEREELCASLRDHLGIAPSVDAAAAPPGWEIARDDSGGLRMMRPQRGRRMSALIMWAIAAIVAVAWISTERSAASGAGSIGALAVMAVLMLGAAWLTWAREEWIVGPGRLVYQLRFGPWLKERRFERARLDIIYTTDSDGDALYRLVVRDGARKRTIESAAHDDVAVADCARWLQAVTGFELTSSTSL